MSCTTTEFHYISLLTHLVSTVQCSLLVGIIQVDSLHVVGMRKLSALQHIQQVIVTRNTSDKSLYRVYALQVLRHDGLTDVGLCTVF